MQGPQCLGIARASAPAWEGMNSRPPRKNASKALNSVESHA